MGQSAFWILFVLVALVGGFLIATLRAKRQASAVPSGARTGSGVFEGQMALQAAELRRLADAARARDESEGRLQGELSATRRAIAELAVRDEERRTREAESMEVIRRLSTVLAGGSAKGRAGENVLHEYLSELPPGMLITDFRVNGKVVEYGLLLPDGRRLPIDSKWSADSELEELAACTDPRERERIAREIERIVAGRAREVAAYLDPSVTAPVAVAAIPDAAYALVRRAHADAYARGVLLVPYSTALPILLFLYALVSRFGNSGDLAACLAEIDSLLDGMESVLENKFERAATMLGNGTNEFRAQLGKARGSMARARVGDSSGAEVAALRAVE